MFAILFSFAIIATLLVIAYVRRRRFAKKYFASYPLGTGIPYVWNCTKMVSAPRNARIQYFVDEFDKYGPSYVLWMLNTHMFSTASADFAQAILTSQTNSTKGELYKVFKPWLQTGLLLSDGEKWHRRRKMLTPSFHFAVLNIVTDVINRHSKIFIKRLETELDSNGFDICKYLTATSFENIVEAAMNVRMDTVHGSAKKYLDNVHLITELFANRMTNPFMHSDIFYRFTRAYRTEQECLKVLHELSSSVIKQRMQERKKQRAQKSNPRNCDEDITNKLKKKQAFLDILLDISENEPGLLSFSDIQEEVDTFMFEGHDTVSTSLAWALFLVGNHPEVQTKIFEELDTVFGSSDRSVDRNDLSQLKYLECVIKESIRLYPPVPMVMRNLQEDVQVGDQILPRGTDVVIHFHAIHRCAAHYPNPNKFDPSNFFVENVQRRHPFAFLPFSAGPRNCIGQKFASMEMLIVLSHFFRHYEIESLHTVKEQKPLLDIILRPENGAWVRIKRRI